MARIDLKEVCKRYVGSDDDAVAGVTHTIEDGEFFVLVGPSGCGKSTLLKMLAGLEDPTSGEIYIDGELSNYVPPGERNVALVFQNYALYPSMTVQANIGFPLRMRSISKRMRPSEIERVADILGLRGLLGRRIDALSGGQRQRVALARALVREPTVTLMDEPLSNLDALLRSQTREQLLLLHREVPGTVVYVTHDQVEAMSMGDRIGVMESGHLVQVGTPRELYERPQTRFVAGFLGSPQMSFLEGAVLRGDKDIEVIHPALEMNPSGKLGPGHELQGSDGVTIGIRPEAVRLSESSDARDGTWQVELVEYLGHEAIVTLSRGDATIRSRVEPAEAPSAGELAGVELDPSGMHLFNLKGNRIDLAPGRVVAKPAG